jgi:LuxR family maltose regulon positive regulatory protein
MDLVGGTVHVFAHHVALGYIALARLRRARGEYDGALSALDDFVRLADERNYVASLVLRASAMAARVELARDNLPAASQWAEASGLCAGDEVSFTREVEYLTLARVLIAQGRLTCRQGGSTSLFHDALYLLERLQSSADAGSRIESVIEINILRALALHALDDSVHATETLERALVLAEPEGYLRIFVDEGVPIRVLLSTMLGEPPGEPGNALQDPILRAYTRLLAAASDRPGVTWERQTSGKQPLQTAVPLLDPLTEREIAVLRLIAAGLSNREIASRLYITVGTAKWYVNSLYSKLDVHSRTQAVVRARSLELLAD